MTNNEYLDNYIICVVHDEETKANLSEVYSMICDSIFIIEAYETSFINCDFYKIPSSYGKNIEDIIDCFNKNILTIDDLEPFTNEES